MSILSCTFSVPNRLGGRKWSRDSPDLPSAAVDRSAESCEGIVSSDLAPIHPRQ